MITEGNQAYYKYNVETICSLDKYLSKRAFISLESAFFVRITEWNTGSYWILWCLRTMLITLGSDDATILFFLKPCIQYDNGPLICLLGPPGLSRLSRLYRAQWPWSLPMMRTLWVRVQLMPLYSPVARGKVFQQPADDRGYPLGYIPVSYLYNADRGRKIETFLSTM